MKAESYPSVSGTHTRVRPRWVQPPRIRHASGVSAVDWASRTHQAWNDLDSSAGLRIPGRSIRVHEPGRLRVVAAWPLSQVLHAAVLVEAVGVASDRWNADTVWRSFRRYRRSDGFLDMPLVGERYYDDNAWIGLACAQRALFTSEAVRATWLRRAEASLRFVSQGVRRDGGVLWKEGGDRLHACSTGSAGLLAAGVARADGHARTLARTAGVFIDTELVNPDGLIADSIGPDGDVDPSEFTYNQGLAIQLRIERGLLGTATDLADRVVAGFAGERFWTHAACFNAILCRALVRLDAVGGTTRYESFVTEYAERLWRDARDERGLFSGAGRYDSGRVLDHAAVTGVLAALALDPERRRILL